MDPRDHLTPDSQALALPLVYSAGWLPLMGSGPSGAPIYLLGKELTTHYQSSFVALYRILHELLQGWCTPVLCCIIFLVADHQTTSTTLSRIWCIGRTVQKSNCSSSIVSAKWALLCSLMCTPPNFLMTFIPRRRSNPQWLAVYH